jgi:hypothetical protein
LWGLQQKLVLVPVKGQIELVVQGQIELVVQGYQKE